MEKISELRVICQTTAKKDISNYYMRYVCRYFSIYLTRLFLPLGVSADQVSFAMIVTGTVAGIFFLCPRNSVFLTGAMLLQLWYLLDCADGEVARYHFYKKKNEVSHDKMQLAMTGAYWDYLNHYIIHGITPFAIAYGLFVQNGRPAWLLIGFLASLSQTLLLAVHDTKSRAYVEKIRKGAVGGTVAQTKASQGAAAAKKKWSPAKWVFVSMHYSCIYPTVMNAVTLTAVLSFVFSDTAGIFREVFLVYYALSSTIVFLGLAAKNLSNQGLDREFEEQFEFQRVASSQL